ncbi:hypothetical protein ACIPY1_15625 [Paenarthrobacter nicotinovorans]|uniref:hypothetical protein n=1 Tax=Paenarthrobacter nicotinovorans TaxID=29320 RepID=UPI00380FE4D1
MEHTTPYWESVAAISPVLGLALIVEIRLVQWHRFPILWRYALGLIAGLVLMGLGIAVTIALGVLRYWDDNHSLHNWQFEFTYWAVYFGILTVLSLPISQLWLVVFIDFSPRGLFLILKMRHLKRKRQKMLAEYDRIIQHYEGMRHEVRIAIFERIIRYPQGVFTTEGALVKLNINDLNIISAREVIDDINNTIKRIQKKVRKRRKEFERQDRQDLKTLGTQPKLAAKRLRRYQNLGR